MVSALKPTYAISRPDHLTQNMFNILGFMRTDDIGDADIVVFPGGADVNPFLYGEKRHSTTQIDYYSDMEDISILKKCTDRQAKVGICRGAQFLNVMVGNGKMYQHVTDHAVYGLHTMKLCRPLKGFCEEVEVTSTHHQMMIPGPGGDVLYAANRAMLKCTDEDETRYQEATRAGIYDDTEVVLYNDRQTLCYQPHPEYLDKGNYFNRECFWGLIAENLLEDHVAKEMWSKFYQLYQRP